jgi:lipoprotein-releasing system permease protein
MKFEMMVALRFLKESKGQTLLIMAGIIIGVSVQIFLASLIGGLQDDLINSTVGDSPHILIGASENRPASFITSEDGQILVSRITESRTLRNIISYNRILQELNEDSRLTAVSPVVNQQAFVTRGGVQSTVSVKGIEFPEGNKIYKISQRLLEIDGELAGNNIYIGTGLSENTGLELSSIMEIRNAFGTSAFYKVAGIFDFENQQLNDALVFMALPSSQSFFQMDGMISHIELQIPQVFEAESITRDLAKKYPDYKLISWQESNQQLLTALNSQSSSSYVIQFFVILAITLGIASVLAINVVQKGKQIGILKAMGDYRWNGQQNFYSPGGNFRIHRLSFWSSLWNSSSKRFYRRNTVDRRGSIISYCDRAWCSNFICFYCYIRQYDSSKYSREKGGSSRSD